jgi:polyisoprenoid-binding protein YceI
MKFILFVLGLSALLILTACSNSGQSPSAEGSPSIPGSEVESSSTALNAIDPEGFTAAIVEGSLARYLVKEQLAKLNFPNDAIGETTDIAGSIMFDMNGSVNSEHSVIRIGLASLKSDESRRDRYVRTTTLQTDKFPYALINVVKLEGLPWPLPPSGTFAFDMETEATIHGQTKPLNWSVMGRVDDGEFQGSAKTAFSFETFEIEKPQLYFILSVEDNIRLELDFRVNVRPNK